MTTTLQSRLELNTDARLDRVAVEAWLKQAPTARFERYASPGLGDYIRLESPAVVGAGLVVESAPVHVELFQNDEQPPTPVHPIPTSWPAPRGASPTNEFVATQPAVRARPTWWGRIWEQLRRPRI